MYFTEYCSVYFTEYCLVYSSLNDFSFFFCVSDKFKLLTQLNTIPGIMTDWYIQSAEEVHDSSRNLEDVRL